MCATCGCGADMHDHTNDHGHDHAHDHSHAHEHDKLDEVEHRRLHVEADLLAKNRLLAERNRGWLAGRGVVALNLVSSPGAGKTTLLERTIRELGRPITVIEGDQATSNDADRIRKAGAHAVQINTGTGCHLDASMIARALPQLDPPAGSLVMIENVGNLVCPALFDLGELAKVLVASVTEGDDKPLKYPHMFRAARVVLLSKIDLAPHCPFDRVRFVAAVAEVNPHARVLPVSAVTGEGLEAWYGWLADRRCSL